MDRYIISIELLDRKVVHHHVICDTSTYLFTLHTRRLYSPRENDYVRNEILQGDLKNVVLFYKDKYQIHHADITLSFGPMLRQMIRERKKGNDILVKNIIL